MSIDPAVIDPAALESFQALALGLAFSGLLASSFELVTNRKASFRLLQGGTVGSLAAVPMLVFSAPFVILRNTMRGRRLQGRSAGFVMLATIIACLWGLMSGHLVRDLLLRLAA